MRRYCWPLAALLVSHFGIADPLDEPLQLANRQPLAQLFGLPPLRPGAVLAEERTELRIAVDLANNFVRDQHAGETLELDGESRRYELGLRRGFGNGVELGLALPWIGHDGGIADNFIEDWHDWFGLPNGDRPQYPTRRLQYFYRRDGVTELDYRRAESGFGDAQLSVAYRLCESVRNAAAVTATLNLPTGDPDRLTGSGKVGGGAALALTHRFELPLTLSVNIGAQWLPDAAVLDVEQKRSAWFAGAELGWAVAQDWRLKAQLQAHSALYDSALRTLGSESLQLLLGGSVRLAQRWLLDVAVSEDIYVDSAPDVGLQLALRMNY